MPTNEIVCDMPRWKRTLLAFVDTETFWEAQRGTHHKLYICVKHWPYRWPRSMRGKLFIVEAGP